MIEIIGFLPRYCFKIKEGCKRDFTHKFYVFLKSLNIIIFKLMDHASHYTAKFFWFSSEYFWIKNLLQPKHFSAAVDSMPPFSLIILSHQRSKIVIHCLINFLTGLWTIMSGLKICLSPCINFLTIPNC